MTEITSSHDGTKHGEQPTQTGSTMQSMAQTDYQPSGMDRYGSEYAPGEPDPSDDHP